MDKLKKKIGYLFLLVKFYIVQIRVFMDVNYTDWIFGDYSIYSIRADKTINKDADGLFKVWCIYM